MKQNHEKTGIYFCSLQSLKHKPLFLHQLHRVLPGCFLEPQDPVPSDICEYWGGGRGVGSRFAWQRAIFLQHRERPVL